MVNLIKKVFFDFKKFSTPADFVTILMLIILSLLLILYNKIINEWFVLFIINLLIIFLIIFLVNKYGIKTLYENEDTISNLSALKILRYWYGVAVILYIFKQVYTIGYSLKLPDWDLIFIKLDFMIFKTNPTQWIYRFENPLLTEFLQIIYIYYYPMIAVFGIELYSKKRYKDFKYTIFILFFSFYLSYLLYLIFPANGPRFHLHDFYSISAELPGIFLTEYIREFINFGESIPKGVPNPQDYVQRDVMPSLHTISALLIAYLSYKFRLKSYYFYLPYLIFMIIATIYLRYHYVVDIFAGFVIGILTIYTGKLIFKNKAEFNT